MRRKGIDIPAKVEAERAFEKVGIEEQKAIVKSVIWKTLAHEYIERRTAAFKNGVFAAGDNVEITEEEVQKYRSELCTKVANAVYPMVEAMLGDDDELRFRIFEKFVEEYPTLEKETKEEICGYHHDYPKYWTETKGTAKRYDEDCEVSGYVENADIYVRKCKYCGKVEEAYSTAQKRRIESDDEYCKWYYAKPKKIYTLKKVDNPINLN